MAALMRTVNSDFDFPFHKIQLKRVVFLIFNVYICEIRGVTVSTIQHKTERNLEFIIVYHCNNTYLWFLIT